MTDPEHHQPPLTSFIETPQPLQRKEAKRNMEHATSVARPGERLFLAVSSDTLSYRRPWYTLLQVSAFPEKKHSSFSDAQLYLAPNIASYPLKSIYTRFLQPPDNYVARGLAIAISDVEGRSAVSQAAHGIRPEPGVGLHCIQ